MGVGDAAAELDALRVPLLHALELPLTLMDRVPEDDADVEADAFALREAGEEGDGDAEAEAAAEVDAVALGECEPEGEGDSRPEADGEAVPLRMGDVVADAETLAVGGG